MTAIEQIRELVYERRPVLKRIVGARGEMTLFDYLRSFSNEVSVAAIESRNDFTSAVFSYADRCLGGELAIQLRDQLIMSPVFITGNHHGPDWIAITSQPSVAWGVCRSDGVVPIFACGGIPLNNLSYGRGIRISDQLRLNIFPDRHKEALVSAAPPFDSSMVEKALASLKASKVFSDAQVAAMQRILEEDYLNSLILSQANFSDQSVLLNRRLWRRQFAPEIRDQMPNLVYLEIEPLVVELLNVDFTQSDFLSALLFDDQIRTSLINRLQGVPGCWDSEKLRGLLDPSVVGERRRQLGSGAGTMFFWAIDERGRRVPLALIDSVLRGFGYDGKQYEFSFKPDTLIPALVEKKLLPSLFTTHLPITFGRGFKPYGGFMQTDYLTRMLVGILETLKEFACMDWANLIEMVLTENYLDGLVFAVKNNSHGMVPAEAVDIVAAGGLTAAHLHELKSITVNEATQAGLIEMYFTIYGAERNTSLIEQARSELSHSSLIQLS